MEKSSKLLYNPSFEVCVLIDEDTSIDIYCWIAGAFPFVMNVTNDGCDVRARQILFRANMVVGFGPATNLIATHLLKKAKADDKDKVRIDGYENKFESNATKKCRQNRCSKKRSLQI